MEVVPDSGSTEEPEFEPVKRGAVMCFLNLKNRTSALTTLFSAQKPQNIFSGLQKNNQGFALVMSLMLTLISLTIIMALFYVVTQGIQTSSQNKKYHTALDASYGGSEIMIKDVMPILMQNYSSASFQATVQGAFAGVTLQVLSNPNCLQSKLKKATANWPVGCSNTSNPKSAPDIQITLQSSSGNPFIVSSKIVDTVSGNSDTSGLQLEGSGTAESSSLLTPQHFPYMYRMDIQGERQNNSTAQANLEVLYAY